MEEVRKMGGFVCLLGGGGVGVGGMGEGFGTMFLSRRRFFCSVSRRSRLSFS